MPMMTLKDALGGQFDDGNHHCLAIEQNLPKHGVREQRENDKIEWRFNFLLRLLSGVTVIEEKVLIYFSYLGS